MLLVVDTRRSRWEEGVDPFGAMGKARPLPLARAERLGVSVRGEGTEGLLRFANRASGSALNVMSESTGGRGGRGVEQEAIGSVRCDAKRSGNNP